MAAELILDLFIDLKLVSIYTMTLKLLRIINSKLSNDTC